MKGFWKWFLIGLGALVILALMFFTAMFFLRSGFDQHAAYGGMMMGPGMHGARMGFSFWRFGMSMLAVFAVMFHIGVLILAGFGVAYLIKRPGDLATVRITTDETKK